MHRRKSSKDNTEQENLVVTPDPLSQKSASIPFPQTTQSNGNGSSEYQSLPLNTKTRINSVLVPQAQPPASAGPHRTSFGSLAQSPPNGYNYPASPLRKSFTHSRTMSSSGLSFASPMLSPPPYGGSTFPSRSITMPGLPSPNLASSPPEPMGSSQQFPNLHESPPSTRRHHQRIHSRNLSVFFPRPGSLPATSIAEDADGSQEVAYSLNDAPVALISPGPSQTQFVRLHNPPGSRRLGEGFTFGGRPTRTMSNTSTSSSSDGASSVNAASVPTVSRATRRGHHHKHSLSHNFFSFLEPGTAQAQISASPEQTWTPISPSPSSAAPSTSTQSEGGTAVGLTSPNPDPLTIRPPVLPKDTIALTAVQFLLGASLWVSGQQHGSLACTGLGYWVVFDSFGVALRHVLPAYLSFDSMQSKTRRPYGNARIETLLLFAQTIYLIFSSVYVCKEAVEHLLLSVGDGHHHHHGDEDTRLEGMQLPVFLITITTISLISTCLFYDNHSNLLSTSGHKLPAFSRILSRPRTYSFSTPKPPVDVILANPFTVTPVVFSCALMFGALVLPSSEHQSFDLLLALLEAVLTFRIAYPAAVVQGAVLLQTAPPRGMPGARMEAFLRVMREIERHPLVLHLPAPHMWQLTPTSTSTPLSSSVLTAKAGVSHTPYGVSDALVVTLELHVRRDTDDGELVALTRWAHERCRLALGLGARERGRGGDREDGAEITIGIVKG